MSMLYSKSFIKTRKETPHGVTSVNHALLERASYISQLGAGIFSYLPLGARVYYKVQDIINEHLDKLGVQQVALASLHPAELWRQSGRFDEIDDELIKLSLSSKDDFVLAMTHEEAVTKMACQNIKTRQDLPFTLNQISKKIRNEARPRGGLIRLKEFTMQDAYSFHATQEELDKTFDDFAKTYEEIFKAVSLDVLQVKAASGIMGGNDSIEFMLVNPAGEDRIWVCPKCKTAFNNEVVPDEKVCPGCKSNLKEERAIELGHIFKLGTKYSEKLGLKYADEKDEEKFVLMGCYGIGIDRLIGAIVENFHDEKGIIWPENVAPAKVYLIDLENDRGQEVYDKLVKENIEVLFDDRQVSAGNKFADADLLGIPYRLVVSAKTGDKIEIKKRDEDKSSLDSLDNVITKLRE